MTKANKNAVAVHHRHCATRSPLTATKITSAYGRSSGLGRGPLRTLRCMRLSSLMASSGPNGSGSLMASMTGTTNLRAMCDFFLAVFRICACRATALTLSGLNALGVKAGRDLRRSLISTPASYSIVAKGNNSRYGSLVAADSATGFSSSITYRTQLRPISIAGAFFVPAMSFYGGCAWGTFECAGVLYARSANPRTVATLFRLAANRGGSPHTGAVPMPTLDPSALRALAHRRMALAALRADSSLSVRLKRYNAHMAIVRTLEGVGGAA
jgi:hypothetical protein